VRTLSGSGSQPEFGHSRVNGPPSDSIELQFGESQNAGVTHPADAWLDGLADGGRLLLPDREAALRENQFDVSPKHGQGILDPGEFRRVMRVENAARFFLVDFHAARELGVADAGLLNGEIHGGLQCHRRWHTHRGSF
jgi:hypothetical protein